MRPSSLNRQGASEAAHRTSMQYSMQLITCPSRDWRKPVLRSVNRQWRFAIVDNEMELSAVQRLILGALSQLPVEVTLRSLTLTLPDDLPLTICNINLWYWYGHTFLRIGVSAFLGEGVSSEHTIVGRANCHVNSLRH